MNRYFCMSPWTHLHPLPDGKVIACCLSPMDQPVGDLDDAPLDVIWNGESMRALRRNMLAGEPTPSICQRCYDKEDNGLSSLRNGMNESYADKFGDLIKTTRADGTLDEFNLVHWDFRFSNICNLKCRTCGPVFSSAWNDDYKALHAPDMEKREFQKHHPKLMKMIRDEEHFWKIMNPLFDSVEMIHFAGGEPLLMDEHYRIMRELTARKQFDTNIRYSTNCSQMVYRGRDVLDIWEPFIKIDLSLSIDGMDNQFDYVRSGGSWEQTKNNLERMRDRRLAGQLQGVRWFYHPTISVMNVFHVLKLHKFLLEEGHIVPDRFFETNAHYTGDFVLNPVIYPDHYNIQILPETIKRRVREAYHDHAQWAESRFGIPADGLMSVVAHMDQEDKSEHLGTFIDLTKRLDEIRKENFIDEFPELAEIFTTRWNA